MVQIALDLTPVTCSVCGITSGLPAAYADTRRDDHATFHCPNGHKQHFVGKSQVERLREHLNEAYEHASSIADQRDAAQRSNVALRGVITRQQRRVIMAAKS